MLNINRMTYEEMSKVVNESYATTKDVRKTVKETGIPFDLVWDDFAFNKRSYNLRWFGSSPDASKSVV